MVKVIIRSEADRDRFIGLLNKMKLDKPLVASCTILRKKRSLQQNKLLWLWIRCISDETGNSSDSLYEYFCTKHLPWNKELVFGEEVKSISGSSKLTSKEFTQLLDDINSQMLDEGIYLPKPGEIGWDEFYERYK